MIAVEPEIRSESIGASHAPARTPRQLLLGCLESIQTGNGSYQFCLLRQTPLDESSIDGDDIDLLGSEQSVTELMGHLSDQIRAGAINLRLHRSNADKYRLTVYSRDFQNRIDFDLWVNLRQIDGGQTCLRFEDVAGILNSKAGIARLRVDVECCVYIHHLVSKRKDLHSSSVTNRLAYYEPLVRESRGGVHQVVRSIQEHRRIDAGMLSATRDVLSRYARGLDRFTQLRRRIGRAASNALHAIRRPRAAKAMAFIGCDGSGKTSVAREIAAQACGDVEFLAGKELYRLSLSFRAVYKFRKKILNISAERLDELLSPLAYACAAASLTRRLDDHVGRNSPMLLVDRFAPDFLYVRRKTDAPRFSRWRRLLPSLGDGVPVVHFIVPFDVLSQRKQEMNANGQARYDADMMAWYTSRRFVDYTAFCNDSTLLEAAELLGEQVKQRQQRTDARPASDTEAETPPSRLAAIWKRLAAPIGAGWGARSVLWAVFAHLVYESIKPTPQIRVLVSMVASGLTCQMALYLFSHRRAMKMRRSLRFVRTVIFIGVGCSLAVVLGVGAMTYGNTWFGLPTRMDKIELLMALIVGTWLLASSFHARVKLLKMVRRSRGWADTARRATRLLLPVGPYQLNRLLDRIESAVESTDDGQELTKSIRGIIDECRVCCDSRFDRAVPWAGAVRVVEAYCDLRNHGAAAGLVRLERNEQLEDTPALPSLICMLAEASIQALPRKKIIVRTSARGNKLVVQITRAADAAVDSTLANRINTGFRQGVVLDRCEVDGRPMWELIFPAAKKLESFDWQSVMSSGDEVGEQVNSRYSKDAKRSFRRNGDVVRMQRSDVHDSKPTRLEDEYLILRRMMDVSPSFPQVTGCGSAKGIDWLSYKFRDGQPLSEWVQRAENRRQWFRVIADVDYLIRCLRENTVAHRDLNPTNLIMGDDGRLGLIDFDQAVADDRNFRFADSEGDSQGLVTNDIAKLIDKCGFARDANEAMARLDEVWGKNNQYELEFAGHVFPGEMPWYAEWEPIACALGDIREKRILVLNAGAPLLPVFLASGRAEVRIVADENQAAAISKIAAAADVEVKFANVDSLEQDRFAPESFDLVLLAGFDARQVPTDSLCRVTGRERQVLFEYAGSIDDAKKLVERIGLIWRGVAGYSARLCPLIVAVHPQHQSSAQWLKVGNS